MQKERKKTNGTGKMSNTGRNMEKKQTRTEPMGLMITEHQGKGGPGGLKPS